MKRDQCALETFDVLAWLMDEINAQSGTLMVTYGGLIRLFREKHLVNPETGEFYGDDIDTWATPDTAEWIVSMEPAMYEKFGWSLRFLTNR